MIVRPTTERQELLAAFPHRVGIAAPAFDGGPMRAAIRDAVAATRGYAPVLPSYYSVSFPPYPYAPPPDPGFSTPTASTRAATAINDYLVAGYEGVR